MKKEKKSQPVQYTIRAVPEEVDAVLRKNSVREGCSLNSYVVDTLRKGAGLSEASQVFHDLDFMSGTWVKDEACEKALEDFNLVDEDMWK